MKKRRGVSEQWTLDGWPATGSDRFTFDIDRAVRMFVYGDLLLHYVSAHKFRYIRVAILKD